MRWRGARVGPAQRQHLATAYQQQYNLAPTAEQLRHLVDRLFGKSELSDQLFTAPVGQWFGPVRSGYGWHPEDLWAWLERIRKQGFEAIAIPHNSNPALVHASGNPKRPADTKRSRGNRAATSMVIPYLVHA